MLQQHGGSQLLNFRPYSAVHTSPQVLASHHAVARRVCVYKLNRIGLGLS